jgi:DNA-binding transcriptional LysR family regulator
LEWAKRLELKFENIYIRLLSEKLADCVDLFSQAKADYLFCYSHEALNLPIDEQKFSGITIGREYLVPVSIPDQNGKPRYALPGSPTQAIPYVAYAHDSLFGKAVDQLIRGHAHTCFLQRRFENAYSHTLKSMVREGLGLAWLPESAITEDLDNGILCRAGDELWNIGFDVKLFHRHAPTSSTELAILETSLEMADQNSSPLL